MLLDFVTLVMCLAPVLGLLAWRRAMWDSHSWLRDVFAGIPRQVAREAVAAQ